MTFISRPIETVTDLEATLARIQELLAVEVGSLEADELEILIVLAERYESEHFPIDAPDPIAALHFRQEQTTTT